MDAGEIVNCPGLALPEPESDMPKMASEAFDVTVSVPLTVPLKVGAKVIVHVRLCPAARLDGTANPLRLNPVPVIAACEIVTLEPPEFVSVTDCVWLLPISTLPKFTLEEL